MALTGVAEAVEALLGIPVLGGVEGIPPEAVEALLAPVEAVEGALVAEAIFHRQCRAAAEAALVYLAQALMALGVLSLLAAAAAGLAAQVVVAAMADFMAAVAAALVLVAVRVAALPVLLGLFGLAVHAAHLHSPRLT
jgi:hypothetical protein